MKNIWGCVFKEQFNNNVVVFLEESIDIVNVNCRLT